MSNPVLVELTRGGRVESVHRGAVVVADGRGQQHLSLGQVEGTGFSALGRQGDAGAAPRRKRRR